MTKTMTDRLGPIPGLTQRPGPQDTNPQGAAQGLHLNPPEPDSAIGPDAHPQLQARNLMLTPKIPFLDPRGLTLTLMVPHPLTPCPSQTLPPHLPGSAWVHN